MKKLFVIIISLLLASCANHPASHQGAERAFDLAPDNHCRMYNGTTCVSVIFDRPPDSNCHMYSGDTCLAPIITQPLMNLAPDASCSMYSGSMCVAPNLTVNQ